MPKICHVNVGCRLSACETEWLAGVITAERGGEAVDSVDAADLVVLGTCCVTARSQARSRKAARRILSSGCPELVVTGCSAKLFPQDFGPDPRVSSRFERAMTISTPCGTRRTRGMLKIQDGCSNRCSYCIVPLARGGSRSAEAGDIADEARMMASSGFREIVLTGVDLASWGRDLEGSGPIRGLPDLVGLLASIGCFRIRLGSLEPMGLGGGELRRLAIPGVCRHLHLSIQSGSTRVLREMSRGYSGEDVAALLEEARAAFPGCIVGADLIAGFPGETDDDFDATHALLSDGLLDYAHVFPFSPRPGTPAIERPVREPDRVVASERARILRTASAVNRRAFRLSQAGSDLQVLVEDRCYKGHHVALSDNYVPIRAPEGSIPGEMVWMRPGRSDILAAFMDRGPDVEGG